MGGMPVGEGRGSLGLLGLVSRCLWKMWPRSYLRMKADLNRGRGQMKNVML
jgi:hypothetical protein